MSTSTALPAGNRLVQGLSATRRRAFVAASTLVPIHFGDVLCEAGEPYRHAHFPDTGVISLVAVVEKHPAVEMGLVGSEGLLGASLVLGVDRAPLRAIVQADGHARRIEAAVLNRLMEAWPPFRVQLGRYLYGLQAQTAQTAACNHFHDIPERLARWLLMMHDRTEGDHFHLTHQFLADMLGVRRSAITLAAGVLQEERIIRYTRGEIRIVSRERLEQAACSCYTAMFDEGIFRAA